MNGSKTGPPISSEIIKTISIELFYKFSEISSSKSFSFLVKTEIKKFNLKNLNKELENEIRKLVVYRLQKYFCDGIDLKDTEKLAEVERKLEKLAKLEPAAKKVNLKEL